MSIPCDTHHLTPFYIIFSILCCVWKFRKGMIRWYIRTHIHEDSRVSIVTAMCGEHSNATFTHHYYRQHQQQQYEVGWCFFATSRHTHSHTTKAFYNSMSSTNSYIHYMFILLHKYMYIRNKFHPLFLCFLQIFIRFNAFGCFSILYKHYFYYCKLHSSPFSSFCTTMYVCVP